MLMKNLLFALPLLVLLGCGKQTAEQPLDFSNITFSIDTVVVNPGEEIINLRSGLWNSVLNDDNSKLYLFDDQTTELAIIDLDSLSLREKVKFQKEGPNGTGAYVTWMSHLDDGRLLISSFDEMGLFDLKGNKLRTYKLSKGTFQGDTLSEGWNFYQKSIIAEDGNVIYGLIGNWMDEKESFAKVDFQKNLIKSIDLPGKESLPDYKVILKTDEMFTIMASDRKLVRVGDQLILSHSAYTNLFIIDLATDSAYQVDYTPQLTAKAKKGGYPAEVDSEKRFREVMEQIYAEINFQAPIWDAKNRRFYRFSYETTPTGNTDGPLFQSAENRSISKVYISVLDENFNLLGESLTDLKHVPAHAFVKDDRIWCYVNVDDELGFVRLKID
jgi:hypothetical protein